MAAGGETKSIEPGSIIAIDPDAAHHEVMSETPPRYIAVLVDRGYFEDELARYPAFPRQPFAFRTFPPGPELLPLLKEFMKEAGSRLPGRDVLLDAIGTRIVHSLIRAAFPLREDADRVSERVDIHRVIEHLHRHYEKKVTVSEMAGVAAMSTAHFSRVFRSETGCPPLEYLIRLRLSKARLLLLADDDSITGIALRCGFATHSHFTACFQQHYGTTPSEYRKSRG